MSKQVDIVIYEKPDAANIIYTMYINVMLQY